MTPAQPASEHSSGEIEPERGKLLESAILKEYESLRAQILQHLEATNNLSTIAVTLAGGILAGFAFLQNSLLSLDHHLQVVGLISLSIVFTTVLFAGVSHDRDMALIAEYIYARVRPALSQILQINIDKLTILDWDGYYSEVRFNGFGRVVDAALGLSRYALPYFISLGALILAGYTYLLFYSFLPSNGFEWGLAIFCIAAALPLLLVFPIAISNVSRVSKFRSNQQKR